MTDRPEPRSPDRPPRNGERDRAGRLAENIVYFARALRAAGIPVGPGAVLDALEAVKAAGVGTRDDFYWTLHAVFVKRHEHSVLFDQAFRIFFRRRGYIDQLLAMMLPQAPSGPPQPPQAGATRVHEALVLRPRRQAQERARDRARHAHDGVRPRSPAEKGFRADDQRRDRRRQGGDEAPGAAARRSAHAAARAASARPSDRHPPHLARQHEGRRRFHRPALHRAEDQAAADRGAARYFRLDEPVQPHLSAFPARADRCAKARQHVSVRHAADQCHARAARARSRRRARRLFGERARLVRRHAHRLVAARLQQAVGAPRAHPGRDRAPHHRRARARRRRHARLRDRPAAPLVPAARLAQSAVALRGLRGARARHQDHAAACRRIPADP